MTKPVILILGHDEGLLETRHWMLERAGLTVWTTTNLTEACQIVWTEPVDVFVLCHTLSNQECESALESVYTCRPSMKNLVMKTAVSACIVDGRVDVKRSYAGPKTLLPALMQLLPEFASYAFQM